MKFSVLTVNRPTAMGMYPGSVSEFASTALYDGLNRNLMPVDFRSCAVQLRAKTTKPFAGITTFAEAMKLCNGGPDARMPPALPATIGFTNLS